MQSSIHNHHMDMYILSFRVVCRTCLAGLHHQLLSCSDNFGEVLVPVHVECDGVVCMVCLDDIH